MATLFIVATPIGNLQDMTYRAVQVLQQVALIACEDTRQTRKLCQHYGINQSLKVVNKYQEVASMHMIVSQLDQGSDVALVSDAGTPLVHDPGVLLVRAVLDAGHQVSPIPGASAVVSALCASGFSADNFVFVGFLPPKRRALESVLASLLSEYRTMVFYEAPHRIVQTVALMCDIFGGDRAVVLAREITKVHEEFVRADLQTLHERLVHGAIVVKGEMVLMLAGVAEKKQPIDDACNIAVSVLLQELLVLGSVKDAAQTAHRLTGLAVNDLYERCLAIKK